MIEICVSIIIVCATAVVVVGCIFCLFAMGLAVYRYFK